MATDSLPVIERADIRGEQPRADAVVHGVVLAAGRSERFGDRNKLLAPVDQEPVVRRATRPLVASDLDAVTVVVRHDADRVRDVLASLDVAFVTASGEGQGWSVAAGVESVRERGADAVLIALGDMPAVSPTSVDRLVAAYRSGVGSALAAGYDGRRGNPVLFDARHFPALGALDGDRGGRGVLLSAVEGVIVETGDPGVLHDVDRPGDR